MRWISSEGGPLIMLQEDCLPFWNGANHDDRSSTTDYERACAINGYIGVVNIGRGYGLVLGDEPLQTTWMASDKPPGGTLLRWRYAEDEESILQHMQNAEEMVFQSPGLAYTVTYPRLVLFDSALAGNGLRATDYIEITLALGRYIVRTGLFQPDIRTGLVLHRLELEN